VSVRWGLLGAGGIARQAIAPAIHSADNARLEAVAARDVRRAESLEPAAYAADDYAQLIDDASIDAIYVALDNGGHERWVIAALEAGKPVLCEKPLGVDLAATKRMREVEAATGGMLVEATWNLWHPRTQRAMSLIASGDIGAVHAVRGVFTFEGVPEDNYRLDPTRGGGAMLDVGCYPLTAAAWATSAAPLYLSETKVSRAKTGVDLTVECAFGFRHGEGIGRVGVLASFSLPEHQALRIDGDGGSIDFLGPDAFTNYRQPSSLVIIDDEDAEVLEHFEPVDPYRVMIEHVSRAVLGEQSWLPEREWSAWVAEATDMAAMPPP
jgi:xylose dehydrogenase (NAD/NADP)